MCFRPIARVRVRLCRVRRVRDRSQVLHRISDPHVLSRLPPLVVDSHRDNVVMIVVQVAQAQARRRAAKAVRVDSRVVRVAESPPVARARVAARRASVERLIRKQ